MQEFSRCSSAPVNNAALHNIANESEVFLQSLESVCSTDSQDACIGSFHGLLKRTLSAPVEPFVRAFSAEDEAVGAMRTRLMNRSFNLRAQKKNLIQIKAATKIQAFVRGQLVRQTLSSNDPDVTWKVQNVRSHPALLMRTTRTDFPNTSSSFGLEGCVRKDLAISMDLSEAKSLDLEVVLSAIEEEGTQDRAELKRRFRHFKVIVEAGVRRSICTCNGDGMRYENTSEFLFSRL